MASGRLAKAWSQYLVWLASKRPDVVARHANLDGPIIMGWTHSKRRIYRKGPLTPPPVCQRCYSQAEHNQVQHSSQRRSAM